MLVPVSVHARGLKQVLSDAVQSENIRTIECEIYVQVIFTSVMLGQTS